jgi:hypothetical protein
MNMQAAPDQENALMEENENEEASPLDEEQDLWGV